MNVKLQQSVKHFHLVEQKMCFEELGPQHLLSRQQIHRPNQLLFADCNGSLKVARHLWHTPSQGELCDLYGFVIIWDIQMRMTVVNAQYSTTESNALSA